MSTPNRRPRGCRRVVVGLAWSGLVVYLICVLMLALLQRSLIYFPSQEAELAPTRSGLPVDQVRAIEMTSHDGLRLHGWHVLPTGASVQDELSADDGLATGGPVVLYFPGNAGNRSFRDDETGLLANLGCHVMLFDYRGYAENAGSPSEANLLADAMSAWKYVTAVRGVEAARIVLYGESLGGGVAVGLAAELCGAGEPPGGLILRSTFSSLVDTAARHYPWMPVRMLMIDRYESADRIHAVSCPILQLHGKRDNIVPLPLAKRLFEAAPDRSAEGIPKRFVELPFADHNDVIFVETPRFTEAVAAFLDAI